MLNELGYSEEDIQTVLRLVAAADSHSSSQEDEAVIVDADSLSKFNIDHVKQKYQASEWMRMYKLWVERLPKQIKTDRAHRLQKIAIEYATSIVGRFDYLKDTRTDLCFVYFSRSIANRGEVGLATVPCESIPSHLLIVVKE